MKLNKIAKILGIDNNTIPEADINWLLTDSRSLSFAGESLFFAITTQRNDGHKYIPELYTQNMRYFVVDKMWPGFEKLTEAVFLQTHNTLHALQTIASVHRHNYDIPIIGITGSNGKTIIKEWLYQLLHTDYKIVRSPRSYNSQIGVPLSIWSLNENTELGIFEAGISQPGEMENLQRIVDPTIGIFTNLGDAHQENFSSLKQKAQEKLRLFVNSEVLIYCKDNKLVDISVQQSGFKGKIFSWGNSKDAVIQITKTKKNTQTIDISFVYLNENFVVSIPFADDASIENSMHCIAAMLYLGYKADEIGKRLESLEPVAMRLEVKEGVRNCLIINDSYNSDLNSLGIALDFQNQQATAKSLSRTVIISDIMQSGLSGEELYGKVAELITHKNINKFIGIGSEISKYAGLFSDTENYFFNTTEDFIKSSLIHSFHNELVLIKGSRQFHLEDVSSQLELIAHETVLEVNLNALVDNFNYFRSKVRAETKIMSMVKAFAYGSGSVEVARTLQHHRCDYLAVAVADEGVELRREGIRIPIAVMNPEKNAFGLILDHKLEPEIYSFELLISFIYAAEKAAITDYPIHIKIDSGMHRLGFAPEEIDRLIALLQNQNQVKIRSVFSHLAASDNPKFDDFTRGQVKVFTECADKITTVFSHKIMRHILNSGGIERFPEYQFDMVRLGIGHYGVSASNGSQLRQVCTLKTIILQIKNIRAGETVGYNRNGELTRDSRIAVLPIGYADGYDRKLGNGTGEVFINGHRAKVIGNVSMDLCTVDVTDIPAKEGDIVEIFGDHITIAEIAAKLGTIPYEVLTGVSRRVKRVYFQE